MTWLTRDSALLYLTFAGVVIGYFVAAEQTPDDWGFRDWMQFLAMVVAWGVGKLQSSPLPHSEHGSARNTPNNE